MPEGQYHELTTTFLWYVLRTSGGVVTDPLPPVHHPIPATSTKRRRVFSTPGAKSSAAFPEHNLLLLTDDEIELPRLGRLASALDNHMSRWN